MDEPLRVLLISGEYPPMEGGVADFTYLLGKALMEQGAQVHILTSAKAAFTRSEGAPHCHPLMPRWSWRPLYATARALVDRVHPDVVNIQYQAAAYDMHPAVSFLPWAHRRVPFVATFHDLRVPYLFPKAGPLRGWVHLALARASSAVIATNAQDRARLAAFGRIRHLALVPIGSNIPCAPPAGFDRMEWRARWGIAAGALLLCYFGFLNPSKGGEELIAALDSLSRAKYDATLLMLGGTVGASDPTNQAYLELVKGSIQRHALEQRVIWTGHMPSEQVSAGFRSADICVLPYRDGASFRRGSFMAALAHGGPIVTTEPQFPLPELVHGENVWLVPPKDAQALSRGIAHLASDPQLRQRLSAGARELSRAFGWQRIAARTLEVYRAVTSP